MHSNHHHRVRTLWLVGILHAFTHVYQVALLPLYLKVQEDLRLESIEKSTFLVTALMISYFLPSYLMGVLADKVSRKKLLAWGLVINGAGFIGLSFAPDYGWAVAGVVVAGLGGSFFHPAATALVARLYPVGKGKALGLVAIGASVGFFIGPLYAGWRAVATGGWRAPVLELGVYGVVAAFLFLWLGDEHGGSKPVKGAVPPQRMFHSQQLLLFFVVAGFFLSLRDFTGSSMGSLGSLFLQKARGFDERQTGLTISCIFLASAISNPVFGRLSDGGRVRWTTFVLTVAAAMVFLFPHVPKAWAGVALGIYGFFFMASYPMVEAALMEAVHDSVRGRVFGLFITIGGLVGNLAHWLAGSWVNHLGDRSRDAAAYYPMYSLLALFILVSFIGLPFLHAIRRREHPEAAVSLSEEAVR